MLKCRVRSQKQRRRKALAKAALKTFSAHNAAKQTAPQNRLATLHRATQKRKAAFAKLPAQQAYLKAKFAILGMFSPEEIERSIAAQNVIWEEQRLDYLELLKTNRKMRRLHRLTYERAA